MDEKTHRHDKLEETVKTIRQKLRGHYQYYGRDHETIVQVVKP
jgi:hypothetical protein